MKPPNRIFAHSATDIFPALSGLLHFGYVVALYFLFPVLPWWSLICLGFTYSVSVSWNINGVAHAFLHNPFFRAPALNRLFSLLESWTMGYSQTFYDRVHTEHHMGNSDRPDEEGKTIDPLSIYRFGHDGEPENVWSYVFCGYFRDDPKAIYRQIRRRSSADARWGIFEIASFVLLWAAAFYFNWRFMVYFLPFYYFGHCLSYLNGYFLHFGANPDVPIAWGVSSYHRLYNWLWFNNGYHAEHHFRPKMHWTQMPRFHAQISDAQRSAGVRVIVPPHALGFLDSSLDPRNDGVAAPGSPAPVVMATGDSRRQR